MPNVNVVAGKDVQSKKVRDVLHDSCGRLSAVEVMMRQMRAQLFPPEPIGGDSCKEESKPTVENLLRDLDSTSSRLAILAEELSEKLS